MSHWLGGWVLVSNKRSFKACKLVLFHQANKCLLRFLIRHLWFLCPSQPRLLMTLLEGLAILVKAELFSFCSFLQREQRLWIGASRFYLIWFDFRGLEKACTQSYWHSFGALIYGGICWLADTHASSSTLIINVYHLRFEKDKFVDLIFLGLDTAGSHQGSRLWEGLISAPQLLYYCTKILYWAGLVGFHFHFA